MGESIYGPGVQVVGHEAMAAPFEVHIVEENALYARQAAQAAFMEVDWLEGYLSHYRDSSDVSRIAKQGAFESVPVAFETLDILRMAAKISQDTGGAFDVTVQSATPEKPRPVVGMQYVELDEAKVAVRLTRAGVKIDLGGIGKGYALDKARAILEDFWQLHNILVSASSTLVALGAPPAKEGWPATIGADDPRGKPPIEIVLKNEALSGSGLRARGLHILDPKTGKPAVGPSQAWALAPTGTLADALSTAFMVMTPKAVEAYCAAHPEVSAVLLPRPGMDYIRIGTRF